MTFWKSRRSRHTDVHYWSSSNSSFEQSPDRQTKTSNPASTSEEALWRLAKRLSSCWRWLKLDFALLAESETFAGIVGSLEESIKPVGMELLPELGRKPLCAQTASQPHVLDLVSVLTSIGSNGQGSSDVVHRGQANFQNKYSNDAATQCDVRGSLEPKGVQSSGRVMSRLVDLNLTGQWVPPDHKSLRRGAIVKCISRATSCNEGPCNVRLVEGQLCKLIETDADGDMRGVTLRPADISNLMIPSERGYWFLQDNFSAFEIWKPTYACSHACVQLRDLRESDVADGHT